jgi:hypothetical protein
MLRPLVPLALTALAIAFAGPWPAPAAATPVRTTLDAELSLNEASRSASGLELASVVLQAGRVTGAATFATRAVDDGFSVRVRLVDARGSWSGRARVRRRAAGGGASRLAGTVRVAAGTGRYARARGRLALTGTITSTLHVFVRMRGAIVSSPRPGPPPPRGARAFAGRLIGTIASDRSPGSEGGSGAGSGAWIVGRLQGVLGGGAMMAQRITDFRSNDVTGPWVMFDGHGSLAGTARYRSTLEEGRTRYEAVPGSFRVLRGTGRHRGTRLSVTEGPAGFVDDDGAALGQTRLRLAGRLTR